MLLALPAASVILVLLRYLTERYRMSGLYTDTGPDDPVIAEVDVTVSVDDGAAPADTSAPTGRSDGSPPTAP